VRSTAATALCSAAEVAFALCARLRVRGARLIELSAKRARIDPRENVAFPHATVIIDEQFRDRSGDLRTHRDGVLSVEGPRRRRALHQRLTNDRLGDER